VNPSRRAFVQGALALCVLPGCFDQDGPLSEAATDLIRWATADLKPGPILDAHVHIVGLGKGDSGCWVHPRMSQMFRHPKHWARFQIYKAAAGIENLDRADQEYVEVLVRLIRSMPVPTKALAFAFDLIHDEDGTPRRDISEFYVPNSHVLQIGRTHPSIFPVASVHPYRGDAVEALHAAAEGGAVAVKWLPNAQRIDPASKLCAKSYKAMVDLRLPLITHAGIEQAVEVEDAQKFGHPLLLRSALDAGVTVIVAHCASLGEYPDTDHPQRTKRSAFDLFLRLMDSSDYADRLWGEISAITIFNRVSGPLPRLLKRRDLHPRLIHGSDYPIPAINPLINTWQLLKEDLIDSAHRAPLSELWERNPILFDYVLKRCLRLEDDPEARFPASVFQPQAGLFPRLEV